MADWGQILPLALTLCALVLVNLIAVLLNMSGVEIAARRDVSENRELRGIGLVNLLNGAYGGTIIAARLGVHRGGLVAGRVLVLLIACFLPARIVVVVPIFVASGLLMFVGLAMLEDWLIVTRKRMILQEWLIVLGILVITISVGILPAVGAGLVPAMLTFVVGYIRVRIARCANSSCAAMQKLGNKMEDQGVAAHPADMSAQLETVFRRSGMDMAGGLFQVWPDFDAALEACEARLLEAQPDAPTARASQAAAVSR